MQRVIETLKKEVDELLKALPPNEACLQEMRANMLQSIADHETAISVIQRTMAVRPVEVARYHRLAAVQLAGYGDIVKKESAHWAYKFVEGVDAYGLSNASLHDVANRLAEFEASGQSVAWSVGYSGGFFDGRHNTSEHADNPYEPKDST